MREKHRKASELPKHTRSSTDTAKTEPNRASPRRDALLPSRAKFLKLRLLPRCRQSRTLTLLPNRAKPMTLRELPSRAKLRRESELPKCKKSRTDKL
jgi:hypothetical protein